MEKIVFKNGEAPYISDTILNQMQNNIEEEFSKKEKRTTLWENGSPTSSFPSQNITLSSDDYDELEIFYGSSTSATTSIATGKTLKGKNIALFVVDGFSRKFYSRAFQRISDTVYTFADCYVGGDGITAITTSNANAIPLKIVGIKH